MVEVQQLLQLFLNNPFFNFFESILQSQSDTAVKTIVSPFLIRDRIAVLEREQMIGAAPAYLKFSQLVLQTKQDLQEAIEQQTTNQHE